MKIYLAAKAKRGFCAGVNRAVETALEQLNDPAGRPVRILHELVHNKTVVESLRQKGCEIVENADDAPEVTPIIADCNSSAGNSDVPESKRLFAPAEIAASHNRLELELFGVPTTTTVSHTEAIRRTAS